MQANAQSKDQQLSQEALLRDRGFFGRMGYRIGRWFERRIINASTVGNAMIYDNEHFPWAKEIEAMTHDIRRELEGVLTHKDDLPAFQDILAEVGAINQDQNWKTFFLAGYGMECGENRKLCPQAAKAVDSIPGMTTAFFSILAPRKHIPAHRGPYNGVLRYHLGLIIPQEKEQCRIRVGQEYRHWEVGESLIFDDTFNHEVWNETDETRVVLFVDFIRPLRFPMNMINRTILRAGNLTSILKRARKAQKTWSDRFYKKDR